jgi:hypothetical protein
MKMYGGNAGIYPSLLTSALVVTVKNTILWDVMPCSPVEVQRCFGGTGAYIFKVEGGGSIYTPEMA